VEPLVLLKSVRDVALLASPDEPRAVKQRAFDAARGRSAAHANLPPARRITERLKLPWREVLAVAHAPEWEQSKLLGAKNREPSSADWLTEAHIAAVLQFVAVRLGADTVSMNEYRAERRRIVAADHTHWLHGRRLLMPEDSQITTAVDSWDDALRLAGLSTQRKRGATRKRPNTPQLVDLIDRFYDAHGLQPTARALKAFARGNGIPYPSVGRGNVFNNAVQECIANRTAGAPPDPSLAPRSVGYPRKGHSIPRNDYSRDLYAALPGERRTDEWDRDACVAAVARYVAQLKSGERSTSRGYRDWAAQQEHAPAMTTIQLHGGWEAVRREALGHVRSRACLARKVLKPSGDGV
jgi:hypothetical protein